MKRTLAIVLALLMVFCIFAACGEKKAETGEQGQGTTTQTGTQTDGEKVGGKGTNENAVTEGGTTVAVDAEGNRLNYCRYELTQMETFPSEDATLELTWEVNFKGVGGLGHPSDRSYYGGFCYENLFDWDSINNKPVPMMAESAEWVSDQVVRIKLNDGMMTVYGDQFTASDVIWSMKTQKDFGFLGSYYSVIDIDNCKVVDDLTVDLALTKSYPFIFLDLCASPFNMYDEQSCKAIAWDEATQAIDPLKLDWAPDAGTGPYKLVDTDKTTFEKYERRDDYWADTKPYYKYVNVNAVLDANTRAMGIESGQYDEGEYMTDAQMAALDASDDFHIWADPTAGTIICIWMNSGVEPFNNVDVRRAVALALDYDTIVEVGLAGRGSTAGTSGGDVLCNRLMDLYQPVDESKPFYCHYDVEQAKQLLAQAGYPDGFTCELPYPSGGTLDKVAEVMQYIYREVGIDMTLTPYDASTFMSTIRDGSMAIAMSQTGNPNPKSYVNKIDPSIGFKSATGWANLDWYTGEGGLDYIQDLANKCYFTTDPTEQAAIWREAQDLCREYVPFIMVALPAVMTVTRSDIVGLYRQSFGTANLPWLYEAAYIGK